MSEVYIIIYKRVVVVVYGVLSNRVSEERPANDIRLLSVMTVVGLCDERKACIAT